MFYPAKPSFRHRQIRDGVIDSICCECLSTVASTSIEFGLTQYEEAHVCDPIRQRQLQAALFLALGTEREGRW
jgi:hypothetical protein